ncbi:fumarylacetoacetate hydrolase family protein [Amycolatopsis pithecellobii]|uniref:fumarylacetoacetate hydrolase family protein n=1 Tax=Amycolatopsis pithecellobii TaxID=664692 RepID=UPI001AA0694A|nr:fumarylacetoacetate hydrolase family protein [Amycolatopsis pithecellobii]
MNTLSEKDGAIRVGVLTETGVFAIPALADYSEVDEVLRDWASVAPVLENWTPAGAEPLGEVRLLAPVRSPRKLLCAGANYVGHAKEMGITELPSGLEPFFFMLPPTSLAGPGEPIVIPGDTAARVDWEAELAVVIGSAGRDIDVADALSHVAGYTILNDISARGLHARPAPLAPPFVYDWLASKGRDSFSPAGPGITPAWLVPDPQELPVRLWRNGKIEQDGNTADMIFTVAELIAAASALMTLEPGDVIATGTPAGVGVAQGKSLADGDVVRVEIGPLGALENPVHAAATIPLATGS